MFWDILLERMENIGEVPICNGMPDRAPHIFGFCFILCYRCTFVIVGITAALIFLKRIRIITNLKYLHKFILIIVLCVPMSADGLFQLFTPYLSNNIMRSVTGFLFGIAAVLFVNTLFEYFESKRLKKKHTV